VRQATGPNEHPTAPTFLQVYKLLSVYSILRPPKTGNCEILDCNPKVTFNDLKKVFSEEQSEREQKIKKLKDKLDYLVEEGSWDPIDDIILQDHNYCNEIKSTVKDCIIYYICGYVCRQVLKRTQCDKCIFALKGSHIYR